MIKNVLTYDNEADRACSKVSYTSSVATSLLQQTLSW